MKRKGIALIGGIAALFLVVSGAFAATLNHPYFPIPLTQTCSITSAPAYCVVPTSSTHYDANATGYNYDVSVWNASGYGGWGDADRLMSLCIANFESGKYTYNFGDNYPSYQGEYSNARFDYGLMSMNSQHYGTHYSDPYYIVVSSYYNMIAAYSLWDASSWYSWTTYTYFDCDDNNGAVWQYVGSSTCSYNPDTGTWGYWSNRWVWVWYLGYSGDWGDGIVHFFC